MNAASLQLLKTKTSLIFFSLVLSLTAGPLLAAAAQDDPERRQAFQLYEEAKYTEALPLFEKLAAAHPDDRDVIKILGLLVIGQTAYLKDPPARKEARRRGRELLVRAQQLGSNDTLVPTVAAKATSTTTTRPCSDCVRGSTRGDANARWGVDTAPP